MNTPSYLLCLIYHNLFFSTFLYQCFLFLTLPPPSYKHAAYFMNIQLTYNWHNWIQEKIPIDLLQVSFGFLALLPRWKLNTQQSETFFFCCCFLSHNTCWDAQHLPISKSALTGVSTRDWNYLVIYFFYQISYSSILFACITMFVIVWHAAAMYVI